MCGIYGCLGDFSAYFNSQSKKFGQSLQHRGPNDQGTYFSDNIFLGFTRLAIVDLSSQSNQPLTYFNRFHLVFNGEIYNYKELAASELNLKGDQIHSDSHILIRLLITQGTNAISKLNGMFAFVFVDSKTGDVIVGRDRLGVKPLYYIEEKQNFIFTSELKAFTQNDFRKWSINNDQLVQFLSLGYTGFGDTIFEGVNKFPKACFAKFNIYDNKKSIKPIVYWDLNNVDKKTFFKESDVDRLYLTLKSAVSSRLTGDLPVSVFLSSGIDSSLVAKVAADYGVTNCLTVGFEDSKYDESIEAQYLAKNLGLTLHKVSIPEITNELLNDVFKAFDEPFADSSSIPSFLLSRAAKGIGTVFLSGDGGDEAFVGYDRHIRRQKIWRGLKKIPELKFMSYLPLGLSKVAVDIDKFFANKKSLEIFYDELPGNPIHRYFLKPEFARKCFKFRSTEILCKTSTMSKYRQFDYDEYLSEDILTKVDRTSMANSIEVRSPFLDYRVHEFANEFADQVHYNKKSGKLLLKKLATRILPFDITAIKKKGFAFPVGKIFERDSIIEEFVNLIETSTITDNIFHKGRILKLAQEKRNTFYNDFKFRIYSFFKWQELYYK